jgi:hypothetical protein
MGAVSDDHQTLHACTANQISFDSHATRGKYDSGQA